MDAQALNDFVTSAKNAGVPRDQLECFLKSGYVPLPWQLGFHATARSCDITGGPVWLGVGGARGPGKSHAVFAQCAIDDCQRVPNLKFLFLRQTSGAAKESFEDLIQKVIKNKIEYEYVNNNIRFANGSKILLGGFHDERDIDKYVGIEYDGIAIEELNQLQRVRVDKLLGSMRTSKPNWRPRLYTSFNPGGKGHNDVKEMFIMPYRKNEETKTRFIPSTYKDNPYLNDEYTEYLEGLEGNLGKAWREGDWDIFEGQFFNEWREARHVVEPYPGGVPKGWKLVRAIDHGRTKPTCCLWGAIDFDGRLHIYREYYMAGVDADINAQKIKELSKDEVYAFTILDSACFSKTGTEETIAEIYERNGVLCLPATKNRKSGWVLVHEYLRGDEFLTADRTLAMQPRVVFYRICYNSIRTIPTLLHDESDPEDLDTNGEDHAADALSYILQWLHESKSPKEKTEIEKKLEAMRKHGTINATNLKDFYSRRR